MNILMKAIVNFWRGWVLLILLGSLHACRAEEESAGQAWPIECVGRMQMKLPGPASVAAFSVKRMQQHIKEGGYPHSFTFPDNTPASYATGPAISHPLNQDEKETLRAAALALKKRVAEQSEQRRRKQGAKVPDVTDLPSSLFDLATDTGWIADNRRVAVYRVIGASMTEWSEELRDADLILKARPRSLFEAPKEPGLCLPYIFAPDNGNVRRGLSMSYRFKDHPDIQVTLTDASAFKPERLYADGNMPEAEVKLRNKNAEPDQQIASYWNQTLYDALEYQSQWLLPSTTRPVTLAGYTGRQSFVRLTMRDGTLNYGYYAVVRGNPDAPEDTPDLSLLVRQDVRLAEGKTPLTKEQFIHMAQAIARSVQRRPVAPN